MIVESIDSKELSINNYDITSVDVNGQWHDPTPVAKPKFVDASSLKNDPRIGDFAFCINLMESPVNGGIRCHALQQRAGDIPLWRNQIPELSIKVMKNGVLQRFHLVSRGTTVQPTRGKPVTISIDEAFTLTYGKMFYQFPLYIGDGGEDLGFSARLNSSKFPLKKDVVCDLSLTFEYGADEPYKLAFAPRDKSFSPVRATWQRTAEIIVTDAPWPKYPLPTTWSDLQNWTDSQGNQLDLLQWLIDSLRRLRTFIPVRTEITISSSWKQKIDTNNNTYWYAFATCENGKRFYCNTKNFNVIPHGNPNDVFSSGEKLFCNIRKNKSGELSASDISGKKSVAISLESKQRILSFKARSLQNRMSLIWSDARSLDNPTCPAHFKKEIIVLNAALLDDLPNEIIDKKILFLLACMHKDAPEKCVQWITSQVKNRSIRNKQAVGFALGDVSTEWQQYVLSELIAHPTSDTLRVFAYAIWREQSFFERFGLSELKTILNKIIVMMTEIKLCPPRKTEKDKLIVRDWIRSTAEPLELLLGLLRTRASSNPEIKMLLQPHQKITKELAKQVERVTDIVFQSNVSLFSRVQLSIQKPEGDRTPDLLYALRLYLTGDDGANAIHVASISDSESD